MKTLALMTPVRSSVAPSIAPSALGDALDAEQIRAEFFHGRVSREWVLDHVAPSAKFYMGRVAVWYRAHVESWLPTYVAEQQQRAGRRRRKAL